ncbi:MAG TPA: hypothetical protein VKV22_03960 [Rhodanobacteraceae bacterium]|nr:hypothetical protein [Rhodanobacteraceae bacterium]
MTITQAITVFGILVAAAVGLSVGYLQRKQARQIELYRKDPSVGLIPPPTATTRFLKKWWFTLLVGVILPVVALADSVTTREPVTQVSVVVISANIAVIVFNIMVLINYHSQDRVLGMIVSLAQVTKRHVAITEKLADKVTSQGSNSNRAGT